MYLFFDTETTGLPRRWNAPLTDSDNWPRMVQLAWIICDRSGNTIESRDAVIRPEGFVIPAEVSRLHGITTEKAMDVGEPIRAVLEEFSDKMDGCGMLVGHNISFDECIVGAEFERQRMMTSLFFKSKCCTMKSAVNYCKLPGRNGYKAPRLSELHRFLFREEFENAHNALADVEATVRCFWRLKELGVIG